MRNRMLSFIRRYDMIAPGDHVICAVSGGADSVALLFAMYLMREEMGITLFRNFCWPVWPLLCFLLVNQQ